MVIKKGEGNKTLIDHKGGLKGFLRLPKKGLSGVVLTNLSDIPAGNLLLGAINVQDNRQANASHIHYNTYDFSVNELHESSGTYRSGEGMNVRIGVEGEQLRLNSGGGNNPLRCIGKNFFIGTLSDQKDTIRFIPDWQGEIDRIFYASGQILKDKE